MVVTVDPSIYKCVVKGHCPPLTLPAFEIFTPESNYYFLLHNHPRQLVLGLGHSGQTFPRTPDHNKGKGNPGRLPKGPRPLKEQVFLCYLKPTNVSIEEIFLISSMNWKLIQ